MKKDFQLGKEAVSVWLTIDKILVAEINAALRASDSNAVKALKSVRRQITKDIKQKFAP